VRATERNTLQNHCEARALHAVLAHWDRARNAPLTPADVSPGSHRRVWWICDRGHSWQAQVKTHAAGVGCPYCTGKRIAVGETDLATTHPLVAAQWHPTKNGDLTPQQVTKGTEKRVWWLCERGHEWQAMVFSRARGAGCPVCTGRTVLPGENDLASQYPLVAAQWHPHKNSPLTPTQVTAFSNRKVWWLCEAGHEWAASVAHRTSAHSGCPVCAGRKVLPGFNDLATKEPRIAAQWHPELNGALTPEMVTVGSHKRVWWLCAEGHEWRAVIHSRAGKQKSGCPVCAGKRR